MTERCIATFGPHVAGADVASLCAELSASSGAEEHEEAFGDTLIFAFGALVCMCAAACAAGLTMGVVSLEEIDLRVKVRCGTAAEQHHASRLLPLIENEPHHQLLVTLLLLNAVANEALPLFLDEMFDPLTAVLVSVTAVLLIGEILPAAVFTGPSKLRIASSLAGLVWFIMYALWPIAYPIGWALDKLIPEHGSVISKKEVQARIDVQRELAAEQGLGLDPEGVSAEEAQLVRGAMTLASKLVVDVMLPLEDVFCLPAANPVDRPTLETLVQRGFSRVPLFEGAKPQLVSYVIVKELLTVVPGSELTMKETPTHTPAWAGPTTNLFELFKSGRCHMAFVSRNPELAQAALERGLAPSGSAAAIGIITLEDILEEILTEEIVDESDVRSAEAEVIKFIPQLRARLQRKLHPSRSAGLVGGTPTLRARGTFSESMRSEKSSPDLRTSTPGAALL